MMQEQGLLSPDEVEHARALRAEGAVEGGVRTGGVEACDLALATRERRQRSPHLPSEQPVERDRALARRVDVGGARVHARVDVNGAA